MRRHKIIEMVTMVTKMLKKMEVDLGFIHIPAKNRVELIGNTSTPFNTKLNDVPAKVDKYGRLWSEYLKDRYPVDTQVTISKNNGGFQITAKEHQENAVGSIPVGSQQNTSVITNTVNEKIVEETMSLELDKIYLGDCAEVLKIIPDGKIDLIVTSPPYADNRKSTYGGVPIKTYVKWFLPISLELKRVLSPTGSFILNIKERAVNGERQTYVIELILEMKKQGWLWTEEYIWHKKNCYPGKWVNRFRDAWERCLQFNKQKKFKMLQKEVMVPMGKWKDKRLTRLSETDKVRDVSKVGSGFGKNVSNWLGRDLVYPTNVLHLATECSNRQHSAAFPIDLPKWFIKLFTEQGDIVLDPFIGSGTTALAALELGRHYIGIEKMEQYYKLAQDKIADFYRKNGHQMELLKVA
jgi:site-specific DNA-methyltransferase (adenine-specific)